MEEQVRPSWLDRCKETPPINDKYALKTCRKSSLKEIPKLKFLKSEKD